jgi:ketosteroid isomerase-like protein
MSMADEIATRLALGELNAAFTHHLDHDEVDALVALFTDDALYTHGARRSEGRAAIEALFRRRAASGTRVSRHVQTGLRIAIEGADRARGTSVCVTFAGDGAPPLQPAVPILVADFVDVYARGTDGQWRFRERHIHRIFESDDSGGPVGR